MLTKDKNVCCNASLKQKKEQISMSDINITIVTGRLVRDPDVRRAATGLAWGTFALAANHRVKPKNGEAREETAFIPCKAFGGWAESLQRHQKGDMAIATGRLVTEKWEKDGETRTTLVLVCDSLRFISLQNGSSGDTREEEELTVLKNGGDEGKPPF